MTCLPTFHPALPLFGSLLNSVEENPVIALSLGICTFEEPAVCYFSGPHMVFLTERLIGIFKMLLSHYKAYSFFNQYSKAKLFIFLV